MPASNDMYNLIVKKLAGDTDSGEPGVGTPTVTKDDPQLLEFRKIIYTKISEAIIEHFTVLTDIKGDTTGDDTYQIISGQVTTNHKDEITETVIGTITYGTVAQLNELFWKKIPDTAKVEVKDNDHLKAAQDRLDILASAVHDWIENHSTYKITEPEATSPLITVQGEGQSPVMPDIKTTLPTQSAPVPFEAWKYFAAAIYKSLIDTTFPVTSGNVNGATDSGDNNGVVTPGTFKSTADTNLMLSANLEISV